MSLTTKTNLRLLALALTPKSGRTILDWNPFNQRTLGKIVDDHNQKCLAEYRKRGWLDEDIEAMVQTIDIVLHDLSSVRQLRAIDYLSIGILVVDLNAIDKINAELNVIKYQMSTYRHPFHLPQISQAHDAASTADSFRPLPFLSTEPEIMRTEPEFEAFLGKLCYLYRIAINTIRTASAQPDGPSNDAAYQQHVERLPNLAANIRDAAISRDLTKDETVVLAQRACVQELYLNQLAEQVRSGERHKIRVHGVRELTFDIPVGPLDFDDAPLENVKLVRLDVEDSMRNLRTTQRGTLSGLGLNRKGHTGIFFDEPSLWKRVELLGSAVKATRFSAALPLWTGLNRDKAGLRSGGALDSSPGL